MPGEARFPRGERLTRKSDFQRIYEQGERWVNEAFILYVVRRTGQGRKLGCTVSRKVGGAVVRNRVKRIIREVYRTHRAQFSDDVHLVVVARAAAARLSGRACAEAMRRVFQKGALLGG